MLCPTCGSRSKTIETHTRSAYMRALCAAQSPHHPGWAAPVIRRHLCLSEACRFRWATAEVSLQAVAALPVPPAVPSLSVAGPDASTEEPVAEELTDAA